MEPSSGAEAPAPPSRPPGRLLPVGLVLVITLVALEAMSVATIMPLVERDLGDLALYGWTFSAFFLGGLVGVVVASSTADRTAPWIPLTGGLSLFAIGLVVAGSAPTMLVLVVGRALQGLGAGALPAVAFVCVGRGFAESARPRMLAWMSSAWMVPSIAGPLLAAWVGAVVGWRWVFLGLLPACAVIGPMAVYAVRVVPAPPRRAASHNIAPALAVALGAGVVLAGLGAARWWVLVVGVVVGSVVLVPAFRRLTPVGTLRATAGIPATVATRGLLGASYHAVDAWVPFAVTTVRGAPAVLGGITLMVASGTWTVASWAQVRLLPRWGTVVLVRVGLVLVAVGCVSMLLVLVPAVPVGAALVAWGIAGAGIGLAWAPITQNGLSSAAHGEEGRITAALQLADMLGIAIGTGIAGAVVAAMARSTGRDRPGLVIVFLAAGLVAVGGSFLAARLRARTPSLDVETGLGDLTAN